MESHLCFPGPEDQPTGRDDVDLVLDGDTVGVVEFEDDNGE